LGALAGAWLLAVSCVFTAGSASAGDKLVEVDRVPAGVTRSLSVPDVITTWGGVTLATWSRPGKNQDTIQVRRAVGETGSLTRVRVGMGQLTTINHVSLLDDPQAKRTFLIANGSGADFAATLGTYVWVSTNQGSSWSRPKKVWDSFGSADAALDGDGGFYLLVNLTGAQIIHVEAPLALHEFPSWTDLGGRLGSRGNLDMASAGKHSKLLLAFEDADDGMWVHRGVTPGTAPETRVFRDHSGPTPVAGDTHGAAVGATRAKQGSVAAIYVRAFGVKNGRLGPAKRVSSRKEDVQGLGFDMVPRVEPNKKSTGRLLAFWRNWDGQLRFAGSRTGKPGGRWSKPITIQQAKHGRYSEFTWPSGNQYWVVATALRKVKGQFRAVMVATRTSKDR